MITIKNTSTEDFEIITHVDASVPGCRVLEPQGGVELLAAGDEICQLGYEPGVSFVIRPVREPEVPRPIRPVSHYAEYTGGRTPHLVSYDGYHAIEWITQELWEDWDLKSGEILVRDHPKYNVMLVRYPSDQPDVGK
ncbi:MAG TPA: hypothetical protein ENH62_05790 [Marinobacter sp.]|uniref:Uncharacterized protein n=1 Tax=marine sediment metagenome TaxID=412755 RepID=A0A0F9VRL7_9ZZZZ|nr:hypothetical protein [Marinobacter sp.]